GPARARMAAPPAQPGAGHDRTLAGARLGADPVRRDGHARLRLRRELVALARPEDPLQNGAVRLRAAGPLMATQTEALSLHAVATPAPVDAIRARPCVSLLGLGLDCMTEAEAIAFIMHRLESGRGGWVITANLDQLRQFRARPELRPCADAADLVVADGMPLVWASRVKGTPLPARIAGSELVWSLSAEAALADKTIFMLGDH